MTTTRLKGVLAPVITPFHADLSVDKARLVAHSRWLISQNSGLALFGTNSEANSLSVEERMELLQAVVEAGLPPARMMPGTGCCALPDSVKLTKHAVSLGCAGVLMLPPFYYKGVSDEGLFRNFAEVVERVGDARLKIYLYHIPPVAQVPITLPLLERLSKAYPQTIVGMKDSSGDWSYTQSVLTGFPHLDMFVGSEAFLLAGMRGGGVGCISATANVNPAAIHALYASWQAPDADAQQAALTATRTTIQAFPMIPALKATRAHYAKDPAWVAVRPPLVALTEKQRAELGTSLEARGFAMPGLAG
ncbi:dihydrodipicolinate synthase family protein [Hypericibacter adhaerens]|jgi:4-hydroxy-tetrahydrodipicolinate synthase|uniref:Dihydrodipicolinate synthase family protein n=1 Tax=Hypericibacter adhaerens TaxID=2602016 RepID=A0A5J6MVM0_9PROT|nr:dihydrodipicolinate synthase family protein [Hypericibacter adhaerens]QEX21173.1 dihydrodipicolinate synthase family protein [Hypericibacter adhaerens]